MDIIGKYDKKLVIDEYGLFYQTNFKSTKHYNKNAFLGVIYIYIYINIYRVTIKECRYFKLEYGRDNFFYHHKI